MHDFALTIALVGVLGIGAQWLAWRTNLPAIALMLVAGVIAGPVLGLVRPEEDLGRLLEPLVAVAVAIILFEGGLNLKLRELNRSDGAVERLVLLGVPIGWGLGAVAGYYVAGLVWPVAILFAGILVVTGPTVVLPMLRQTHVASRPRAILKWEAIVNDPIGALCAVVAYEWLRQSQTGGTFVDNLAVLAAAGLVAGLLGYGAARAIAWIFPRGLVPEYLKAPVLLVAVIATYVAADLVYKETGLLTVTVMGMALANMQLSSAREFMRFKENVTVLLVSGVFVLLSASLDFEILRRFDWRFLAFVGALILVVRPATVILSLAFSKVPWKERLFIGAVAPRGIVAVAISGFFALRLDEIGYGDGGALVALSFAVVAGTILVYGFSMGPLARLAGLTAGERKGLLIVGSTPWSVELGRTLTALGIPVTVADTSWQRLGYARQDSALRTFHGEILAEATEDHLDMDRFQALIAASDNEAYNALVCSEFAPEVGRDLVYQLGDAAGDDPRALPDTLRGRALFSSGLGVEDLNLRHAAGWHLEAISIGDSNGDNPEPLALPDGTDPLAIVGKDGRLHFFTHASRPKPGPGDTVLVYSPPHPAAHRALERETSHVERGQTA